MSKMESKSVRNLELNFAALPRGKKNVHNQPPTNNEQYYEEPVPEVQKPINPMDKQEFPMLSSNGAGAAFAALPRVNIANKIGKGGLARTNENFPSLGPSSGPLTMPKTMPKPATKTTIAHALKPNHAAPTRPQEVKSVQQKNPTKKDIKKPTLQNNQVEKRSLYEDFPTLPVTKNLQKVLKFPAQNKNAAANLIEYSTLAKTEPKLRLVNNENAQKAKEKPKPASLNINSDLNFPSLGDSKLSDTNPPSIREKEPKSTPTPTNNKPMKNKINTKHLRNKHEEQVLTNNYTVLPANTISPSPAYIRPPNEDNRNKV